eukprot:gene9412-12676_t
MGNASSNELDSTRIAEITTEANGTFSKEFSLAYKDAVVNKIKSAYLQGNLILSLMSSNLPTQRIKQGSLLKIGANVKNWKKRYFVVLNKADNYSIVYYEDETETSEKGRFTCCGYIVEAFDEEEIFRYGQYGIKLRSSDVSKRLWLLRTESEEEQQQWIEVLSNVCRKVKSEPLRDSVLSDAFKSAFRATRASYGYFGVFTICGTECDMLESLITDILNREMLDQFIYEKTNLNLQKKKEIIIQINLHVQKLIKPVISSTWRGNLTSAEVMKASFELSVKASLRVLLEKENEIKKFLGDQISSLVDPFLPEIKDRICFPTLKCCFNSLLEAYEQCLNSFHHSIRQIMGTLEVYPERLSSEILLIEASIENIYAGPLSNCRPILWDMYTINMNDMTSIFEMTGLAPYDVYLTTIDDLKTLFSNALFTFSRLSQMHNPSVIAANNMNGSLSLSALPLSESFANNSNNNLSNLSKKSNKFQSSPTNSPSSTPLPIEKSFSEILNEVISKLTSDAKIYLQRDVINLLNDLLEAKLQELLIAPCYDIVLSASFLINRETNQMINLSSLGENMIREYVTAYLNSLIEDMMSEASSRLNMVAVQLIDSSTKLS